MEPTIKDMDLAFECRDCYMKFESAELLANHKNKFCVGSEFSAESLAQKVPGIPVTRVRFEDVKKSVFSLEVSDKRVSNMTLQDIRLNMQGDPTSAAGLQTEIVSRLEQEKLANLKRYREEQERARKERFEEEKKVLDMVQELEKRKEKELKIRMEKDKAKKMLEDVEKTKLSSLQQEKRKEIEVLVRERETLLKKEEEALREIERMQDMIVGQEVQQRERERKLNELLTSTHDGKRDKDRDKQAKLAQERGQQLAMRLEQSKKLLAEREAIARKLKDRGGALSKADLEAVIEQAKSQQGDASKRLEELKKGMAESMGKSSALSSDDPELDSFLKLKNPKDQDIDDFLKQLGGTSGSNIKSAPATARPRSSDDVYGEALSSHRTKKQSTTATTTSTLKKRQSTSAQGLQSHASASEQPAAPIAPKSEDLHDFRHVLEPQPPGLQIVATPPPQPSSHLQNRMVISPPRESQTSSAGLQQHPLGFPLIPGGAGGAGGPLLPPPPGSAAAMLANPNFGFMPQQQQQGYLGGMMPNFGGGGGLAPPAFPGAMQMGARMGMGMGMGAGGGPQLLGSSAGKLNQILAEVQRLKEVYATRGPSGDPSLWAQIQALESAAQNLYFQKMAKEGQSMYGGGAGMPGFDPMAMYGPGGGVVGASAFPQGIGMGMGMNPLMAAGGGPGGAPFGATNPFMTQIQKQMNAMQQLLSDHESENKRLQNELEDALSHARRGGIGVREEMSIMPKRLSVPTQDRARSFSDSGPRGMMPTMLPADGRGMGEESLPPKDVHEKFDSGDPLANLQLEHRKELERIQFEMQKIEQMAKLDKLKKEYERERMEEDKRVQHELWVEQQKRALIEARMRKQLAQEGVATMAAGAMPMGPQGHTLPQSPPGGGGAPRASFQNAMAQPQAQGPSASVPPRPSEYDPDSGLVFFFDYVTGLPKRATQIQMAYGLYQDSIPKSPIKGTPISTCDAEDAVRQRCIFALQRKFPKISAIPNLKAVLEIQLVLKPPSGPNDAAKVQSIGWTIVDVFDEKGKLCAGVWKIPVFWPPTALLQTTKTIDSSHKRVPLMEIFLRITTQQDATSLFHSFFVINPDTTQGQYSYPPGYLHSQQSASVAPSLPSGAPSGGGGVPAVAPAQPQPQPPQPAQLQPSQVTFSDQRSISTPQPKTQPSEALDRKSSLAQNVSTAMQNIGGTFKNTVQAAVATTNEFDENHKPEDGLGVLALRVSVPDTPEALLSLSVSLVLSSNIESGGSVDSSSDQILGKWQSRYVPMSTASLGWFEWNEPSPLFKYVPPAPPSSTSGRAWFAKNCSLVFEIYTTLEETQTPAKTSLLAKTILPAYSKSSIWKINEGKQSLSFGPSQASGVGLGSSGSDYTLEVQIFSKENVPLLDAEDGGSEKSQGPQSSSQQNGGAAGGGSSSLSPDAFVACTLPPRTAHFENGEGFDVYIDSARFLPDNVTATKVSAYIANKDHKNLGSPFDGFSLYDGPASSPIFHIRFEFRGDKMDPTCTLLIQMDTLEAHSNVCKCIGFSALNIFVDSNTSEQPTASNATNFSLNEGGFQLPVRMGPPPPGPGGARVLMSVRALDSVPKLSCASILVRIVKAPKGSGSMSPALPPLYSSGGRYDTTMYGVPSAAESVLLQKKSKIESITVTEAILPAIRKLASHYMDTSDLFDEEITDFLQKHLTRPKFANLEMLDYTYLIPYDENMGFQVDIDRVLNANPPKSSLQIFKVLFSLSPPGLLYGPSPLTEGLHFTQSHAWAESLPGHQIFTDGYQLITNTKLNPRTVLIVDVRAMGYNAKTGALETSEVGWSVIPIFTPDGYVRTGTFMLPLYSHPLPQSFLSDLESKGFGVVMTESMKSKRIKKIEFASVIVKLMDGHRDLHHDKEFNVESVDQTLIFDDKIRPKYKKLSTSGKKLQTLLGAQDPSEFEAKLNEDFTQKMDIV